MLFDIGKSRENRPYYFTSVQELKECFSEYLSSEEMEFILIDRIKAAGRLEGDPMEKAHWEFLASCAEAMELASELKMMGL